MTHCTNRRLPEGPPSLHSTLTGPDLRRGVDHDPPLQGTPTNRPLRDFVRENGVVLISIEVIIFWINNLILCTFFFFVVNNPQNLES